MTKIEWTERTWNPIAGCSVTSPGCKNCYAMRMAARLEAMGVEHYRGLTQPSKAGAVWTGKLAQAPESVLLEPLKRKKPTTYFVNSMSDLFHENVPDEWIDKVFAVMALCPRHTFQVLTKRAERMRKYMLPTSSIPILGRFPLERVHFEAQSDEGPWPALKEYGNLYSLYCSVPWPLSNVWLGVSAEDQTRADERIPHLLQTPAAVRFISAEPLLGPVDLTRINLGTCKATFYDDPEIEHATFFMDALRGVNKGAIPALDWVIVGGESGPGARPMHPDWPRSLRDQCQAAGVSFFMKQWGQFASAKGYPGSTPIDHVFDDGYQMVSVGKKRAGRLLDGCTWDQMPGRAA